MVYESSSPKQFKSWRQHLHVHLLIDNASASSQYKFTKLQYQKKTLQFIYNNILQSNNEIIP